MKKFLSARVAIELISSLFILLFVYTALNKLIEHTKFELVLKKSPLLEGYAVEVSWLLPIAEIIVSFLLLFPAMRKYGLYGAAVLMVLFTLYIVYMLLFTPNLPCSCGGVLEGLNWTQHLLFNIFFLLLSILALMMYKKHELFIAINRHRRTPVEKSRQPLIK